MALRSRDRNPLVHPIAGCPFAANSGNRPTRGRPL
jgi:hypothetical protein